MAYIDAGMEGRYIFASVHPYDPDMKDRLKYEIPGAAYEPETKRWRYPLDLAVCYALRDVFGKALRVRVPLAEWAAKEIKLRKELQDLATADTASVRFLAEEAPVLYAAMQARPYQLVGSAWISRTGSALLGDDPGLGKTLQVMGAVVESGIAGPILVFAPKTAALVTWPDELRKWLPDDDFTVVSHLPGVRRRQVIGNYLRRARGAYERGQRAWLICNMEMVRIKVHKEKDYRGRDTKVTKKDSRGNILTTVHYPQLFDGIKWQAVIIDESQNALITQTPQWWNQTQVRAGLTKLPIAKGGLKVALSGTFMRGKLENAWGTLNWLDPEKYTSYWNWCQKRFTVTDKFFGGQNISENTLDDMEERALAEFYDELRPYMLRRTKAEVATDLPPKQYAGTRLVEQNPDSPPGIWLPIEGKQLKLYREMKADAEMRLSNGTLMAMGILHEMSLLKQVASSAGSMRVSVDKEGKEHYHYVPELPSIKFDWLLEWLTERGMCGEKFGDSKVVIASQYTSLLNLYVSELNKFGVETFLLTGETSPNKRKQMANRFQEPGGPRVFMLNTTAGGVSLTLDAADDLILLDETWIPDDQTQVEDRIHRVSRIHNVTIWYVRMLGTIEETIATVAGGRDQLQRKLMDGQRGVGYAKQLLGEAK
jgi:SNF2 family DNA or RNA helicase